MVFYISNVLFNFSSVWILSISICVTEYLVQTRFEQDTCLGDKIKQKHNSETQIVSIEISNLIVLAAAHVSMCPGNHVSPPAQYCDTGDPRRHQPIWNIYQDWFFGAFGAILVDRSGSPEIINTIKNPRSETTYVFTMRPF